MSTPTIMPNSDKLNRKKLRMVMPKIILVSLLLVSTVFSSGTSAATTKETEDVLRSSEWHDEESTLCTVGSPSGSSTSDPSGSNERIGYISNLEGPYILEQFAIHSLKALAAAKGVPETDTVTEEHVIALVAFSIGEGGDIANRNIFNPLNHGKISNDNGTLTGDGTSGFVKYSTFDDGVDSNARVLNGTYQQRVANALTDPSISAEQFMEKLSYWSEHPGDKYWAEASSDGVRGSDAKSSVGLTADEYYSSRVALVNQVRANPGAWENSAGLQVGTDAEEQKTGAKIPSLLTYYPAGSGTGSADTPDGGTAGPPSVSCPTEKGIIAAEPEIDKSKKDTFNKDADGNQRATITPTGVVLHWTGAAANRTVDEFISDIRSNTACGDNGCSVQFYVKGDGTIYQLVDPINTLTGHAAGANNCCIGIEIGGTGESDLQKNAAQRQAVVNLTAYLVSNFKMQVSPDIPGLKGILSHHATPKGVENGKTDVGDQYWLDIIAAVNEAAEDESNCPSGVSEGAEYTEWCAELKKLLEGPDKNRISSAKQAKLDSGSLLAEDQASDIGATRIATDIKVDLEEMILAAATADPAIDLEPVSGYRTFEEQALQRIQFCSNNQKDLSTETIFFNESANCSTAVLIPGTSKHNKGRAIDFGKDGRTDDPNYSKTASYTWLVANASKYGFRTISDEPWHWEK